MKDLIEALQIFAKYQKETARPTTCEKGLLMAAGVHIRDVSNADNIRLGALSFYWALDTEKYYSYRFGSTQSAY